MKPLRFAVFGCGFWSQFQIAAWLELGGVELVAVYNRTRSRAEAIAQRFGVPAVYDDAEKLLANEKLDFIDIITDPNTHGQFVNLAARYKVPVICQKPMAPDLTTAVNMERACREANVPFMIHDNWRWQYPIRQVKQALDSAGVGKPFRARLTFSTSFPVSDNQLFLRELDQFIITDIGSHLFDTARFLFGDARSVYCQTRHINPILKGEDVATAMMLMGDDVTVTCEMSYASPVEHDRFPETYMVIECENGTVELGPDFWVRVTTKGKGTHIQRFPPPCFSWADPQYAVVHSSIYACNVNLLHALQTGESAETSGEDNLKTVRLVFAAYDSAATGNTVMLV